jgi:hypothetical protein
MKIIKISAILVSLGLLFSVSTASADSFQAIGTLRTVASSSVAKSDACSALNQIDSSTSCGGGSQTVTNVAAEAVSILALIVGIAAVIMIIFSGFKFITANGDPQAVSTARNTLIYAIIGIIVAVMAQFIASHVLITAVNTKTGLLDNIKVLSIYS